MGTTLAASVCPDGCAIGGYGLGGVGCVVEFAGQWNGSRADEAYGLVEADGTIRDEGRGRQRYRMREFRRVGGWCPSQSRGAVRV